MYGLIATLIATRLLPDCYSWEAGADAGNILGHELPRTVRTSSENEQAAEA
jgi:hypothetical protein